MKNLLKKLKAIQEKHAYWNWKKEKIPVSSGGTDCSDIGGEQCHGDGQCMGDGE